MFTLYYTIPTYNGPEKITALRKKVFENILGKGENIGNQHFLLFTKCFPFPKQISVV